MTTIGNCPNCGTPRTQDDAFCEVCGLDYATGELPQPPEPAGPAPAGGAASGWQVEWSADRAWFDHNEAEGGAVVAFPDSAPARRIDLAGEVVTIGRRDERNGWYPDIDLGHPVDDLGASRRHAELRHEADQWLLVDVGSTNGTRVNDTALIPDTPTPVGPDDVIHVGAFTRLRLLPPEEADS